MGHFKVSVDMPNLMKGVPVEVPPVGIIENGDSLVVEREVNPFLVKLEEGDDAETELRVPAGVKVEATSAPKEDMSPTVAAAVEAEEGGDSE